MAKVAILIQSKFANQAEALSKKLSLPLVSEAELSSVQAYLFFDANSVVDANVNAHFDTDVASMDTKFLPTLKLQGQWEGAPGPIWADFLEGKLAHRKKFGIGKNQILGKALGLRRGYKTVLDLTAGLGGDSFVMSGMGLKVLAVERSAFIFALLEDGLRRLECEDDLGSETFKAFDIVWGDALNVMANWADEKPDLIYLDPMYPHRKKDALSAKEMQVLQVLLKDDKQEEQLLEKALQLARHRVVVKRPLQAPPILASPDHSYRGKTVRFDMYLDKALAAD